MCGAPVHTMANKNSNPNQRVEVFEGTIHKCPYCGVIINAFNSKCSTCGHEFRDSNTTKTVNKIEADIKEIEAKRKNGIPLLSVYNLGANSTDLKVANYIKTVAIPNNTEDLIEILVLSCSNIDPDCFRTGSNILISDRQGAIAKTNAWIVLF